MEREQSGKFLRFIPLYCKGYQVCREDILLNKTSSNTAV